MSLEFYINESASTTPPRYYPTGPDAHGVYVVMDRSTGRVVSRHSAKDKAERAAKHVADYYQKS